ncbi:MAG TPA: SBBP repeat-containing protein, partial [Gemmataceae bacterium]|nr:SBBP repeat-containing protein [Gemmataceae bacterium]
MAQTPLMFEPNMGQTDSQVQFLVRGSGYTAFLTATDQVLELPGATPVVASPASGPGPLGKLSLPHAPVNLNSGNTGTTDAAPNVVTMHLIGSSAAVQPIGQDPLETRTNYFIGNDPTKWHTDIPNYGQVLYPSVYPGVDLVYHSSSDHQLEYDFVVAPGVDPGVVQMAAQGTHNIRVDAQGNLVLSTSGSDLVEHAPGIYQDEDGVRHAVAGRYVLEGAEQVGFQVDAYDRSRPLVIDPSLSYSTYLDGSVDSYGESIAVDSTGSAYVTGYTASTDFPIRNALQMTNNGAFYNAFVAKLNATGNALAYSTYLGGSYEDEAYGIAVDSSGNAYVTGYTESANFPTTAGAFQTSLRGFPNAFVAKLNSSGSSLLYSTFLGGNASDQAAGIAVDAAGEAFVTGSTSSTNFPTTTGAFQSSLQGQVDAFVTKLNALGSSLLYSTYLGGSLGSGSSATGIAVDTAGEAFVTGSTFSTNFPTTAGAFQTNLQGSGTNAFVTKLNASGSSPLYSTYLGGSGHLNGGDRALGIAVDTAGEAFVTGITTSTNFPTTTGVFQSSLPGPESAFVTKLNTLGSSLLYSTYLGGSNFDEATGIAVDGAGNAYVTGETASGDFPTQNPLQAQYYGLTSNAFVTRLSSGGNLLLYSTYLGGSGSDYGSAIAADSSGNVYLTGATSSSNFPTQNPFQSSFSGVNGGDDAFVARVSPFGTALMHTPTPIPPTFDFSNTTNQAAELIKTVPGAGGGDPESMGFSEAGVRYFDGTVQLPSTDLQSAGFGTPWGQDRSWTNGPNYASNSFNGSGMVDSELPHLIQTNFNGQTSSYDTIAVISTGTNARFFDTSDGTNYQDRFFLLDQFTHNSATNDFTLTDTTGQQIKFYDFSANWPVNQCGQFESLTDPYGNITSVVSHTSDGKVIEVQRSNTTGGTTIIESYLYSYLTSGADANLLQNVTLRRQVNGGNWATVRQVGYTYYGDGTSSDTHGNVGDLRTATITDGTNTLDTKYYRYYTGESGGYVHGLKYMFEPQSYARLTAALGTGVAALTDAQVAPYADNYFQYDSLQRVTRADIQGAGSSTGTTAGVGTYLYSYAISSNPVGFNSWQGVTTETLPDGNLNIVYTNVYGEVMLKDFHDATLNQDWDTYYRYDSQGRLVLTAEPSAVTGYNATTYADLVNYPNIGYLNSTGLIKKTDYYTSTNAGETTAGAVTGYEQDTTLQQGVNASSSILQDSMQYFAHTGATSTTIVNPIATRTVYRNTNGTGGETTSYAYTWFPSSTQVASMTVTSPIVSTAENGPGTADLETSVYDTYGRVIWSRNSINPSGGQADGYITYTAYDQATGAVVETIQDVDTTRTGDFTNLPSGWITPTGGGLRLITQMVVDMLGRTTKLTDPNGNMTYTVYNDPNHEVRTYPGWQASTNTTTGPTQVTREDRTHSPSYTESFTMSAAPHVTNGQPDGTEAYNYLQSLSRTITSPGGQVIESDAYFNLVGVPYSTNTYLGTAGTNFNATQYAYDTARGWRTRVLDATGTINRTVYDSLGRVVSTWVGTNDTPASGSWSPSNNTAPSNMVQVTSNIYDGGGVGDSNLTQVTQYPSGSTGTRVTQNFYDWRDRLVASKQGVGTNETTGDGIHRPVMYTVYDNLNEPTSQQQYDGDGIPVSIDSQGNLISPGAGQLRARTDTFYDDQGRVYQTQTYDVNQSTGALSSSTLVTNTWYDHRGHVIKVSPPGGPTTKTSYDGADRPTFVYTTDANGDHPTGDPNTWNDASTVSSSNNVLHQTQTVYDQDGNVTLTITKDRFNTETMGGPLADANPNDHPNARVSYVAQYYDAANRLTNTANVGTNHAQSYTPPNSPPTGSNTVLVMTQSYQADAVQLVSLTYPHPPSPPPPGSDALSPSLSTLSAGNHVITATYSGDSIFPASTTTLASGETINTQATAGTTTTVTPSVNPQAVGQPVTWTATVTGDTGPVNSVNFETGNFSQVAAQLGGSIVTSPALDGTYSAQLVRSNSVANIEIRQSGTTYYNLPTAYYS